MTKDDLKRLRERNGWSQTDLANVLNQALGKNYTTSSISPWENGKRNVPKDVAAFCERLLIETNLGGLDDSAGQTPDPDAPSDRPPVEDSVPGLGTPPPQPVISPTGGTYQKACEELWEIIGGGVGMIGGAIGSEPLMVDGQIIVGDKAALGASWGKLAETNETFRRFLAGALEGGAWMQVALATGSTIAKCQQNHAAYALAARAARNGHADGAETLRWADGVEPPQGH